MQTTAVNARGQVDERRTHSCVDQSAVSRSTDQRGGTLTKGGFSQLLNVAAQMQRPPD